MKNLDRIFGWSLIAGSLYFLLVTAAHSLELKLPGVFVYFDVPSTQYQNKIIAFLAFGWALFFYLGKVLIDIGHPRYLLFQIVSGGFAILIFALINLSGELRLLVPADRLWQYWLATGILALYWLWLVLLFILKMRAMR